jgi:hypothetical protein
MGGSSSSKREKYSLLFLFLFHAEFPETASRSHVVIVTVEKSEKA